MYKISIPNYQIYGESGASTMPEAIGCERIEERSSLHNWHIKPHRHHQLYQFFALSKGGGTATIDEQIFEYVAPTLIVLPPLTVHGFQWHKNSSGFVISAFKSEVFQILTSMPTLRIHFNQPILLSQENLVIDWHKFYALFANFYKEYKTNEVGRMAALHCLLALILLGSIRAAFGKTSITRHPPENESTFSQFAELVDKHYHEHKSVSFYADALNITTAKLNRLSQMFLNCSPHELLDGRLLLEAKRNILYTAMTANQVAYNLGFKDPAYFSRFFRKHTGEAPMQFRNRS